MKVTWRSTTPPGEVVWRPRDGQRVLEEGRRRSPWGRAMADIGASTVGGLLDGRRSVSALGQSVGAWTGGDRRWEAGAALGRRRSASTSDVMGMVNVGHRPRCERSTSGLGVGCFYGRRSASVGTRNGGRSAVTDGMGGSLRGRRDMGVFLELGTGCFN
jgi:hypothetical protein